MTALKLQRRQDNRDAAGVVGEPLWQRGEGSWGRSGLPLPPVTEQEVSELQVQVLVSVSETSIHTTKTQQ